MLRAKNFKAADSALKRKLLGRPRRVRTPENIQIVHEFILRSPKHSARKQSASLSLSIRGVRRILKSNLKFYKYQLMVAQELLEPNHETRVACCKDIFKNVPANAILITSNKAHFHLSDFVNYRSSWSESNPKELHERPLYNEQVTVW